MKEQIYSIRIHGNTKSKFEDVLTKRKNELRKKGKKITADGLIQELIRSFRKNN